MYRGTGVHTLYSPICLDIADLQMPTVMSLRYSSKHGSLEAGWSNCWACYIGGICSLHVCNRYFPIMFGYA